MIRANKVKIMTRAAIFEKNEGRKALYITRFFQNDYILYGLLKSAVSVTLAFVLGTCMWVVYHAESLMTEKTIADLIHLGEQALSWYGVTMGSFLLVSLIVCVVRYQSAQKRMKGYRGNLRKLLKMYQEEGAARERSI